MSGLSHAETGDRDYDRAGIRAIDGVEELSLRRGNYKRFDGQRQFERDYLGRLGRTLPKEFDLPAYMGYSVGHWERDVSEEDLFHL
jgi:hypothetical protein